MSCQFRSPKTEKLRVFGEISLIDGQPRTHDATAVGDAELLALLQVDYVLCESAREVPAPDGWDTVRAKQYGRTAVTLLARA